MNIGIIGCGYVGLANAILLALRENVTLWDINANKLQDILNGTLPFEDNELDCALCNVKDKLSSAKNLEELVINSQLILIAIPTDYSIEHNELNTVDIEETIKYISECEKFKEKIIVIRSTVPIGFTDRLQEKYKNIELYFMPEFLREGCCYLDTLFPERIVIGGKTKYINKIYQLYCDSMKMAGGNAETRYFFMSAKEAEAVKLFSNSYLSMRVAFFNELDLFSEENHMSTNNIIQAVCADSRVGNIYNSPSFGYGGYCLPKDTNQLAKQLNLPLVNAINKSNNYRKDYVCRKIISMGEPIGIYRIQSKKGADNTRYSVMYELIEQLSINDIEVFYYEPLLKENLKLKNTIRVNSISDLAKCSNIIIANWIDSEVLPYWDKVYTRDINNDLLT